MDPGRGYISLKAPPPSFTVPGKLLESQIQSSGITLSRLSGSHTQRGWAQREGNGLTPGASLASRARNGLNWESREGAGSQATFPHPQSLGEAVWEQLPAWLASWGGLILMSSTELEPANTSPFFNLPRRKCCQGRRDRPP